MQGARSNELDRYVGAVEAGPARVGGKAWNLVRLARWGFVVPQGLAIEAAIYDAVLGGEAIAPLVAVAKGI